MNFTLTKDIESVKISCDYGEIALKVWTRIKGCDADSFDLIYMTVSEIILVPENTAILDLDHVKNLLVSMNFTPQNAQHIVNFLSSGAV